MEKRIFYFFKKPIPLITIAIILGVVAWFIFFSGDDTPAFDFIIAQQGDVIQEVSVTGRVKPAESVQLAFEKGGRVGWVRTEVGKEAFVGQVLVGLESGDIAARLLQARSQVREQEAKYAELLRGTRPEEIEVQEVKVSNKETSYKEARQNLVNKLNDSYTKADDAIRGKVDQFFDNPRTSNPQISFTTTQTQLETEVEFERFEIENLLISWKNSLTTLNTDEDLVLFTTSAKENLSNVQSFLDNVALVVNSLSSTVNLSQTTVDGYKTDIATARTNVNTAISNLGTANEKSKDAQSALALAQQELILKQSGSTVEELQGQEARIAKAQASVKQYQAELAKTIISAPINGIVTLMDAKVGEIIAANTVIVSLISVSQFEIEANVPEADIAKLTIGNLGRVTLDAYGSDVVFEVRITKIDPAETVIEGIATYKTTLQFKDGDGRVKSGMTANIDISTGESKDVIVIPGRAVITKNGKKFVRVVDDGGIIREAIVITGLRGSDGSIEITEGITEGEKVIIFLEEK